MSTNALDAKPTPHRTFVVVFDDLHLGHASSLRAKEVSEQFIAEHTRPGDQVLFLAPGEDVVQLVTTPGEQGSLAALTGLLRGQREAAPAITDDESFRIVEEGDSTVEEAVLARLRGSGTLPWAGVESVRSEARRVLERARDGRRRLLSALASTLDVLTTSPTRKSVLLVSEGFNHDPRDRHSYDVIVASQRARAAVSFLDVRGLTVGDRPDGARPPSDATGAEILASITGGSTVRDVEDLGEALDRLSREASHHYVLGYLPSSRGRAERLRRIRVTVSRPDVVVQARRGYWDAPDIRRGPDLEGSSLDPALRNALNIPALLRQIPLRLTALTQAPDHGRVRVTVAAEASARPLKLEPRSDGSRGATLDVALAVTHIVPGASEVVSMEGLAVRVPGGAREEGTWLPFERSFTLPPGLSQVKVVVRDRGSGAIGSVVRDLVVPAADELRVSSPILSDTPDGEGVRPPRIAARRSFVAGGVLYCYFDVYPGPGIPAPEPTAAFASYEIVDRRGQVRVRAPLPLPVRRNDGGQSRLLEIPLTRLGPGEYELVLDLGAEVQGSTAVLREPFSLTRPRSFSDDLYRAALGAYLDGDFQAAVTTLLQWPAKDVRGAARRLPPNAAQLRETALLLHTDLALLLRRHARDIDADTQLGIGRALLEDAALPDLHREWLLTVAHAHQAHSFAAEALAFYTECARLFPDAGQARLGAGTLFERNAFLSSGYARGNLHVRPRLAAREAERWYREALQAQPSLTEARLRLARVLQRTKRLDEALAQLSLVTESNDDASLRALAHLFWGEIEEGRGDNDGALEHYRAAVATDRDLQVAALALAQALHRRDGRQAAVAALVPALGDGGGTTPWLAYCRGPRRLSASPLDELRSRLRPVAGDPR